MCGEGGWGGKQEARTQVHGLWAVGRRPQGWLTVPRGPEWLALGPRGESCKRVRVAARLLSLVEREGTCRHGAPGSDCGVWSRAPLRDLWFYFHSKRTEVEARLLQNTRDS